MKHYGRKCGGFISNTAAGNALGPCSFISPHKNTQGAGLPLNIGRSGCDGLSGS